MARHRYDICAISDTLTDYILPVAAGEVARLGLVRGQSFALDEPTRRRIEERFAREPDRVLICAGGSPTNTIHGASRLHLRCAFIGCVGSDDNGYRYIRSLRDDDIDAFVSIKDGPSGIAYTLIEPDGERTFGVDFGVSKQLMPYQVLYQVLAESHFLHYSAYELRGDTPLAAATRMAHRRALRYGSHVSMDLGDPGLVETCQEAVQEVLDYGLSVVFANREEARLYSSGPDPWQLGDLLQKHAEVVVVKLGAEGCLVRTREEVRRIRTLPVSHPVDTNGAGDAFQAGFLYGLCRELPLPLCARIGNYYASHILQVLGAQSRVRLEGIEYLVPPEGTEEVRRTA